MLTEGYLYAIQLSDGGYGLFEYEVGGQLINPYSVKNIVSATLLQEPLAVYVSKYYGNKWYVESGLELKWVDVLGIVKVKLSVEN